MWVAQQHFKAEKYWDAIRQLEPLIPQVEGATRIEVQMLLAQAISRITGWRKRAEAVLLTLVNETPKYCPAHLLLAEIYRGSGLVARARACYRKVLTIQPENETATRELAGLEPAETSPPGSLRGFFIRPEPSPYSSRAVLGSHRGSRDAWVMPHLLRRCLWTNSSWSWVTRYSRASRWVVRPGPAPGLSGHARLLAEGAAAKVTSRMSEVRTGYDAETPC